ncbi:outer membrane beta-barrel protein [Lichenibacterium ramalinae]|uniref:Outer membrane beta-barrel protein n=1 Tax=Lichenibacterium ramalinae TaxID=2316527 RepID=A0A4Q2RC77_9HYPH|nr:outer membrane beta-barrel protein [Lichenibacterium ramalinae]RYB04166.1 hypothetical protein D3272_14210 [Lichenibacterium ramalinae]
MLQVAGLAAAVAAVAPASAQQTSGGLSTTIPSLRGSVDGAAGGAAAVGGDLDAAGAPPPALPGADPAGTSAAGGTPAARPRGRFAPPKGTAKTEDRVRRPRVGPPPLPELQAYPASLRLRGSGAAIDTVGDALRPGPTVAALPITARLRTRIDDTPFDAIGYDVGSLRLTPYVTQSFGFDSNPDQIQTGLRPSAFERTEGGFGLASQWSRNQLTASFHGGYDAFFSAPEANRPDAVGLADYRFDVDRDTTLDAEARFALDTQRVGSPEVVNGAQGRPLISTFGGAVGGAEQFGRLDLALHGSLDRTAYDNAQGTGGVLQDLASENFNDAGLRLRATYEMTPVLRPFVDLFADDRLHDSDLDYTGYRRDSVGATGQVGSTFELTRLLSGEVSAGYGGRSYEDARLKSIASPVFNGALSYAATPLTAISFRAATSFDETTVAGASGTESRSVTLEVTHALMRNLTITGAISYLNTEYVGVPITENTLSETLKAEYRLSRSLVATASFNHERLNSTLAGASFGQNVALLGLRWQR